MSLPINFNTAYRRVMSIRESYFNRGQLRMYHHMYMADMSRLYHSATSQSLEMWRFADIYLLCRCNKLPYSDVHRLQRLRHNATFNHV